MKGAGVFSVLLLFASTASLRANDICEAVALRDVPSLDDPSSVLKSGEHDEAVTQYRVDKKTGETSFCSHGGLCYPTHITENGAKIEALRLTNCKIGKRDPYDDPDMVFYEVDVIRSKVTPSELKYYDLANKLKDMGLCNACADNAAGLTVNKPASRCAQLTKKALEGDAKAIEKLKESPDYCNTR